MNDVWKHSYLACRLGGLIAVACLVTLIGCGGGSSAMSNPTPTTNTSPPAAATQTSSSAYTATIFAGGNGSSSQPQGTITVNAQSDNGNGTLHVTGAQAASAYDLQFCAQPDICKPITKFTTDTNGSANVTFQVPPGTSGTAGHYAGSFLLFQNGTVAYNSGADAQVSGVSFAAPLIPVLPENPPGGGSVSVSGQTLHVALNGVPPNLNYEVELCSFESVGLRCNSFGTVTVTVNAQGNGSRDYDIGAPTFVGFVLIKNQFNQQYESGFRAP
jgi:hypothetical protein